MSHRPTACPTGSPSVKHRLPLFTPTSLSVISNLRLHKGSLSNLPARLVFTSQYVRSGAPSPSSTCETSDCLYRLVSCQLLWLLPAGVPLTSHLLHVTVETSLGKVNIPACGWQAYVYPCHIYINTLLVFVGLHNDVFAHPSSYASVCSFCPQWNWRQYRHCSLAYFGGLVGDA